MCLNDFLDWDLHFMPKYFHYNGYYFKSCLTFEQISGLAQKNGVAYKKNCVVRFSHSVVLSVPLTPYPLYRVIQNLGPHSWAKMVATWGNPTIVPSNITNLKNIWGRSRFAFHFSLFHGLFGKMSSFSFCVFSALLHNVNDYSSK